MQYPKAQLIMYSDRLALGSRTDDIILNSSALENPIFTIDSSMSEDFKSNC